MLVADGLEPLVALRIADADVGGEVLEPGACGCTMPVLCAFGDVDNVAGMETDGRFAPFLIDALAADADEDLVCAVVDVPVVAATRLKGYIGIILNSLFAFRKVLWMNLCKVTLSCERLSVSIVRVALCP